MILSLNYRRVSLVIFGMGADKTDINNFVLINDHNHQPVTIAFDVEHHPVICQKTGIMMRRFDVGGSFPIGSTHAVIPDFQRYLAIGVFLSKRTQGAPADDSHRMSISQSYHFGN